MSQSQDGSHLKFAIEIRQACHIYMSTQEKTTKVAGNQYPAENN